MKGEKTAKRSSFGSIVRKRLSDITNSQLQTKIDGQEECLVQISPLAKECIDKLIKLCSKLLELSGVEIKKLNIYVQKMQMQNWNLARSNSHMLAELNVGKEKCNALQHEIACKDAVLKSKKLAMEAPVVSLSFSSTTQHDGNEGRGSREEKDADVEKCLPNVDDDKKTSNANRRQAARSRSMASSTTSQQAAEKVTAENIWLASRRRSARFNIHEACEVSENLFEIEDMKLAVSLESPMQADDSRKSLSGRPSRRVTEKVKCYREPPRNIKMRRTE